MVMRTIERDDTQVIEFLDTPDEPLTDEQEKSESLFEALKSDPSSFISVQKQSVAGNQAMEFVGRFPADKYDLGQLLEHVKNTYGGGDYRFMAYSQGKLKANKLISISNPIKLGVAGTGSDGVLQQVLANMEKMQQQMLNLAQGGNTQGNSRKEMFEELLLMKQFFDSGNKSGGIGEVIQTITALKDLGLNLGLPSGDDESSGFGALAEKLIPLATAMVTAPQPRQAPPVYKQNPVQERPVNNQPNPDQQNQQANKMNMLIKMGIAQLVNGAAKGSDPFNYVATVMDNVPDDKLKEFFQSGTLDNLAAIDPRVKKYEAWFTDLGEHIKANLGLPSKFSDLYEDEEEDIVDETLSDTENEGMAT